MSPTNRVSCLLFVCLSILLSLASSPPSKAASNGNDCKKLKDLEFGLFGIRTTYTDARNFLRRSDEDDLPESFDDDSMNEEHKGLKKEGCKPQMIYLLARHSANQPNVIKHYERLLRLVIGLSGHDEQSREHLADYFNWRPSSLDMTSLLSEFGGFEERQMAARFARLYPELFSTRTSTVKFAFLNESRLEWTAREFLKQVEDNENIIPECLKHDHQVCSAQLREASFSNPILNFDSMQCNHNHNHNHNYQHHLSSSDQVNHTHIRLYLAQRVAAKLHLRMVATTNGDQLFSLDTFESVYRICKHESALYNDSIWCNLFDKHDFQVLEYLEDLESYYREAYGPKVDLFQTCALVKDLLNSFESVANENETLTESTRGKRRSNFYFVHINALRRLYATFGLFRDDQSYGKEAIEKFEQTLEVPQRRNWRSSVQVPYSGNMAFVLYKCLESNKSIKHKVLVTVNEQPVELPSCEADTECELDTLLEASKKWRKQCENLPKLCPSPTRHQTPANSGKSDATISTKTAATKKQFIKTPKIVHNDQTNRHTSKKDNNEQQHIFVRPIPLATIYRQPTRQYGRQEGPRPPVHKTQSRNYSNRQHHSQFYQYQLVGPHHEPSGAHSDHVGGYGISIEPQLDNSNHHHHHHGQGQPVDEAHQLAISAGHHQTQSPAVQVVMFQRSEDHLDPNHSSGFTQRYSH